MVIQTELGLLRRTHYSVQLHEASGKSATVMGWISAVRGHGNISFVTLLDTIHAQITRRASAYIGNSISQRHSSSYHIHGKWNHP